VCFDAPPAPEPGKPCRLSKVRLLHRQVPHLPWEGRLYYRARGETEFTVAPFQQACGDVFFAEVPGELTAGPFEYRLEFCEFGCEPITVPPHGAVARVAVQ